VLLAILGLAAAACPNACSGNGVCGANDKCSCYQNFQGADCSLRTCTFTLAWADTADGTNQAHYYAECGNKGVCDRKTGECKCFDGYEGKGCRRSTCPDDCSGHGTCEYIEELAGDYQNRRQGPGNWMQDMSCRDARSGHGSSCRQTVTNVEPVAEQVRIAKLVCTLGSGNAAITYGSVYDASGNIELGALAADKLVVVAQALYDAVTTGDAVTYAKGGGTVPTALAEGTLYVYKHGTANTLVLFSTQAAATATYANDAAAVTAGLDAKTGAAGTAHTFTRQSLRYLSKNIPFGDSAADANTKLDALESTGPAITATYSDGSTFCAAAGTNTVTLTFATGAPLTAVTSATSGVTIKADQHCAGASCTAASQTGSVAYSAAVTGVAGFGGLTTSTITARTANTDISHGHLYQLWDAGKIQGCKCDLGYDGPDCAHRISPHGDDPLTTVKSSMMKQVVQVGHAAAFSTDPRTKEEFIMVYHDPYGGVWRTDGIAASSSDIIAASRVEDALRALPNEVLEGVSVKARESSTVKLCTRFNDGVQHLGGFSASEGYTGANPALSGSTNFCETTYTLNIDSNKMDFTIEFADKPGQTGVQYLMEIDINKRGAGSFPVSGGITGTSAGWSVAEMNYNTHLGNLSELAECSDRGLDDGDGACECFDGFRGLACEEQEALV
jgi:hypothetical protein